jgi:Arc/MetJ-type ribon-helix-helix transcriptional regulator
VSPLGKRRKLTGSVSRSGYQFHGRSEEINSESFAIGLRNSASFASLRSGGNVMTRHIKWPDTAYEHIITEEIDEAIHNIASEYQFHPVAILRMLHSESKKTDAAFRADHVSRRGVPPSETTEFVIRFLRGLSERDERMLSKLIEEKRRYPDKNISRTIYDPNRVAKLTFPRKIEEQIEKLVGSPAYKTRKEVIESALDLSENQESEIHPDLQKDPTLLLGRILKDTLKHYDDRTGALMQHNGIDTYVGTDNANITITMPRRDLDTIERLARQGHVTNGDVLKRALGAYFKTANSRGKKSATTGGPATARPIKNKAQVLIQSRLIVASLEEILEYRPQHHNRPPPDLWMEDSAYLQEVKNLVAELRILNAHLAAAKFNKRKTQQSALRVGKRFDTFLHHYSASLGKGAGYLTIAAFAGLLFHVGVGPEFIGKILGRCAP